MEATLAVEFLRHFLFEKVMSVYVDKPIHKYRRMIMCHMIADSLSELHEMASKIGMKLTWFQPTSFPHYDLSLSRRKLALKFGAIEVDRRGLVKVMKNVRSTIQK